MTRSELASKIYSLSGRSYPSIGLNHVKVNNTIQDMIINARLWNCDGRNLLGWALTREEGVV